MVAQKNIAIGDNVAFTFGLTPIQGVVIDDRGPIGANSIRIFRVRIPNDPYEDDVIEMPEDELALTEKNKRSIPAEQIMNYFENGGLVQILKSNISGGQSQPCACCEVHRTMPTEFIVLPNDPA